MLYILEPHGDDALISCYPLLKSEAEPITIVTLGKSRSSEKLASHFPAIQDVIYADLYEISIHIARASYYRDFLRWQREKNYTSLTPWTWQRDETRACAGELWVESESILHDFLDEFLLKIPAGSRVLAPIGIVHPYHILVSSYMDVFQKCVRADLKYGYYSDAPYNGSAWTRPIEDAHPQIEMAKLQLREWSSDGWEEKEQIFRDVYPNEVQKLFRFSFVETIQNPYRIYLPCESES